MSPCRRASTRLCALRPGFFFVFFKQLPADTASAGDFDGLTEAFKKLTVSAVSIDRPDVPYKRQDVVETILRPSFESKRHLTLITEDHDCFRLPKLTAFREKYKIGVHQWNNYVRLLCGCLDLPMIILQNPCKDHNKEYGKMVKSWTLNWLSGVLSTIGLRLEDVVVLDICSLLSDDDLAQLQRTLGSNAKWAAVEDSYDLSEEILRLLKPPVVISCQCRTKGDINMRTGYVRWAPAKNQLARVLASSLDSTNRAEAAKISIGPDTMWMVNGVHPRSTNYSKILRLTLVEMYHDVYGACMEWFHGRAADRLATLVATAIRLDPDAGKVISGRREQTDDGKAAVVVIEEVPPLLLS